MSRCIPICCLVFILGLIRTTATRNLLIESHLENSFPEVDHGQQDTLPSEQHNLFGWPFPGQDQHKTLEEYQSELRNMTSEEKLERVRKAINDDNSVLLEAALLEGIDSNAQYRTQSLIVLIKRDHYLLYWAARANSVKCVKVLIKYKAIIQSRDLDGNTALHAAAERGSKDAALELLKAGAYVDSRNNNWERPLHIAAANAQKEMMIYLLLCGADKYSRTLRGVTAMHLAAISHPNIVEFLVSIGTRVNDVDSFLRTPLHYAASSVLGATRVLIDAGAYVNAVDFRGRTPLHVAVASRLIDAVKILLKTDVDVSAQDIRMQTPLHIASAGGFTEICQVLVDNGASTKARDMTFRRPNDMVCSSALTRCTTSQRDSILDILRRDRQEN